MNLARAMGVPAPKFISYAEPPPSHKLRFDIGAGCPSLLMTRLSGTEMDALDDEDVDFDLVKADIIRILTTMRSFSSPYGPAICGVDGGPLVGPLIPTPFPPCPDEAAFYQQIRYIANFAGKDPKDIAATEKFFAHPTHAVVFTHGDLNRHNIMVGPDGHVCGIIDWESAGWLPDYWEVSVTAILPRRHWGQFMHENVTAGVYAEEVEGHRSMFPHISDSLSY